MGPPKLEYFFFQTSCQEAGVGIESGIDRAAAAQSELLPAIYCTFL